MEVVLEESEIYQPASLNTANKNWTHQVVEMPAKNSPIGINLNKG